MTSLHIAGVPAVVFIAILVMLAAAAVLKRTSIGRELFAIGSNPEAASLVGIPCPSSSAGAFAMPGYSQGLMGRCGPPVTPPWTRA